tara:strand:+ start:384 stop:878 length:495 start_codon:yes stop_codon:yes gene_type:complete
MIVTLQSEESEEAKKLFQEIINHLRGLLKVIFNLSILISTILKNKYTQGSVLEDEYNSQIKEDSKSKDEIILQEKDIILENPITDGSIKKGAEVSKSGCIENVIEKNESKDLEKDSELSSSKEINSPLKNKSNNDIPKESSEVLKTTSNSDKKEENQIKEIDSI